MPNMQYIKKIRLSDGETYWIYDAGAPRTEDLENYLPIAGGTITGNLDVDLKITAGELAVESIEYINTATDNVLIQKADGSIAKRSANNLLEDIGGCSYSMNDSTGVLSFKIGK